MTLPELRATADATWSAFLSVGREHGFADEWQAYRAEQRGEAWPKALAESHDAAMRDLHAFYLARDGAAGVLGSRGL